MKNILVPVDFSDNSKQALRFALEFFADGDSQFTILNTYFIPYPSTQVRITGDDVIEQRAAETYEEFIADILEEYPDITSRVKFLFKIGQIEAVVNALVHNDEYDIIVMGTKGASGIKEVLIGTTTASLIGKVKTPIIAVPEDCELKKPKKIVFALDHLNKLERAALSPLISLAEKYKSEIQILNVYMFDNDLSREEKGQIADLFEGVDYSLHEVKNENIGEGIEEFVKAFGVDMLCLVHHKYSFFEKLFHKSMTKKMSMHTHIPLIALQGA